MWSDFIRFQATLNTVRNSTIVLMIWRDDEGGLKVGGWVGMVCMCSSTKFSTSIKIPNFSWKRIDYERYTVTHHLKSMMHQCQNRCIYFLFWIHTSASLVVYTWKPTNALLNYYVEQKVWWQCVIRLHSIPSYTEHGEKLSYSSKRYDAMSGVVLKWVG